MLTDQTAPMSPMHSSEIGAKVAPEEPETQQVHNEREVERPSRQYVSYEQVTATQPVTHEGIRVTDGDEDVTEERTEEAEELPELSCFQKVWNGPSDEQFWEIDTHIWEDEADGQDGPQTDDPLFPEITEKMRSFVDNCIGTNELQKDIAWGISFAIATALLGMLMFLHAFGARVNGVEPTALNCRNYYWSQDCGLNGINCYSNHDGPFTSDWNAIRCPALYTTGMVIGSGPYLPTSTLCRAAVHAGAIGMNGGCAMVKYTGPQEIFTSNDAHGVTPRNFNSWFPSSLVIQAASDSSGCSDGTG